MLSYSIAPIPCGLLPGSGGYSAKIDLKASCHTVERFAIDTEYFSGTLTITSSGLKDMKKIATLDFV